MAGAIRSHGELMVSFFHYAARLLADGELTTLQLMGIEPADIRALEGLTVTQLHRLAELSTHFIDFRVSRPCLERILRRLAAERDELALQDRLFAAGAPAPMMAHYFGLSSTECSARRQWLGIAKSAGRPRSLSDAEFDRLLQAWRATAELTDPRQRLLELAGRTQLSLELIWPVFLEWEAEASEASTGAGV